MRKIDQALQTLATETKAELRRNAVEALPPGLRALVGDDGNGDDDDDDDDDDDEDDDDEDDDDDDDDAQAAQTATDDEDDDDGLAEYWIFTTPDNAEENLACAAGAYRAVGDDQCVVAQHRKTGVAFMGEFEDLEDWCESNDCDIDDFKLYDNHRRIMGLEYDQQTIAEILKDAHTDGDLADARSEYEKFHWNQSSNGTEVITLPGIDAPMYRIGTAKRIEYTARKDGEVADFYHVHGEESGQFPSIYALKLGDTFNAYLVVGGKMEVRPEGITD